MRFMMYTTFLDVILLTLLLSLSQLNAYQERGYFNNTSINQDSTCSSQTLFGLSELTNGDSRLLSSKPTCDASKMASMDGRDSVMWPATWRALNSLLLRNMSLDGIYTRGT